MARDSDQIRKWRSSPVKQLRERSREGRKETGRGPSTEDPGNGMGNQVGITGKKGNREGNRAPASNARQNRVEKGTEEAEAE